MLQENIALQGILNKCFSKNIIPYSIFYKTASKFSMIFLLCAFQMPRRSRLYKYNFYAIILNQVFYCFCTRKSIFRYWCLVAELVEATIIGFSNNDRFDASTSSATTSSTPTTTRKYNDFIVEQVDKQARKRAKHHTR